MRLRRISISALIISAALTASCSENRQQRAELVMTQHAMINGEADTLPQHRAVVGLYSKNGTGDCSDRLFCTGTLIHPKWVLTAAHCVTDTDEWTYKVTPSECNPFLHIGIGNTEDEIAKTLYDAKNIYYHKNYKERNETRTIGTIDADIALIELKEEIPETIAKPILAHPIWLSPNKYLNESEADFSGFGFDENGEFGKKIHFKGNIAQYCNSPAKFDSYKGCYVGPVTVSGCHPNPDYCEYYGAYDNETEEVLMPYGSLYYKQDEGGPCQGDSGGPAFVNIGGVEYVSGVTSYGDGVCGVYGISTAVANYYNWILGYAPEIAKQYSEICNNEIDDNGSGKVDCDDPQCADFTACKKEICDNKIDDNGDNKVDCDDPQCADFTACKKEICDNKIDDNGDNKIDCDDPQCADFTACKKEICDNKIDDNGDNKIDCDDPQCAGFTACKKEICSNKIDDNGDNKIDCDDPQCAGDSACIPSTESPDAPNNDKTRDNPADSLTNPTDAETPPASSSANSSCSAAVHSGIPSGGTLMLCLVALSTLLLRRRTIHFSK